MSPNPKSPMKPSKAAPEAWRSVLYMASISLELQKCRLLPWRSWEQRNCPWGPMDPTWSNWPGNDWWSKNFTIFGRVNMGKSCTSDLDSHFKCESWALPPPKCMEMYGHVRPISALSDPKVLWAAPHPRNQCANADPFAHPCGVGQLCEVLIDFDYPKTSKERNIPKPWRLTDFFAFPKSLWVALPSCVFWWFISK